MINKFILIALCLSSATVFAQDYYVLQVKGTVRLAKTGAALKSKDVISGADKLIFSTPNDAVAVVSSKNGRAVITPTARKRSSELTVMVKDIILPATNKLSTRSGRWNSSVEMKAYLKDTLLLLEAITFRVNPVAFPIDQENFFFIRYKYRDDVINKRIRNSGDSLMIERSGLFMVDDVPIPPGAVSSMQLLRKEGSSVQVMGDLYLSAPDNKAVWDELLIIRQVRGSAIGSDAVIEEFESHLNDSYGKVDHQDFLRWYNHQKDAR
jgi:hypothetical protein